MPPSLLGDMSDLWAELNEAVKFGHLHDIALDVGFTTERLANPGYVLGVDGSAWVRVCLSRLERRSSPGTNPELEPLFLRLSLLLRAPVIPILVFDSPGAGGDSDGDVHRLERALQRLAAAFGFHWYTAPGFAAAELARLEYENRVDTVMVDDPFVLLFGAQKLLRIPEDGINVEHTAIYQMGAIAHTPGGLRLSRGGLILVAVLVGDDSNIGLPGCTMALALGLAQCGLGDILFNAAVVTILVIFLGH